MAGGAVLTDNRLLSGDRVCARSGRLARGRNYARRGQVLGFEISCGYVTAQVQGSRPRPYRVRIQVTRCPLIIRHPDRARAGQVVEGFVQHQDLMPTLLHLLGEPALDRCNGENAWPLVTGERRGGLRDRVISAFGWYASVRTAEWNYHAAWAPPPGGRVRPPELYDRRHDPEELTNVIEQHPEVAQELQARLSELLEDQTAAGAVGETETPAAVPGVKW